MEAAYPLALTQQDHALIGELAEIIGQIDDITQQNAALVEQAAAAAESLQEQSAMLAKAVSVFRLNDEPQYPLISGNTALILPANRRPPPRLH